MFHRSHATLNSCFTVCLLLVGQHGHAQDQSIDVIVVTPVPGQGMARANFAANVQNATSVELENSHATDLSAFLNRRLGSVYINDVQNNPFQPDVNFRGFTASPLLGTAQGLSVYLDGVRLNQPFGDVVSWDLIPRSAIASMTLMPGSNPLFGLNTLGGALNVQTKDGLANPGTSVQAEGGRFQRHAVEFEHGGSTASGWQWYFTGNRYHENGWRQASPSDIRQLYGKAGYSGEQSTMNLSVAMANNELNGNGMQERSLLIADRSSVYTLPDKTHNSGLLVNFTGTRQLTGHWSLAGNAYFRRLYTDTFNGDLNTDALDQAVYQPDAGEEAALTAAGYTGFPAAGENAANTPFPRWRCIAQSLLRDAPGNTCTGIINTTLTKQHIHGFNLQMSDNAGFAGKANLLIAGIAFDQSKVDFRQNAELGYLNADHSVTATGAIADGVHAGTIDGEPYDSRVDLSAATRTASLYVTDTLTLAADTHITFSGRFNRTRVHTHDFINPAGGPGSLESEQQYSRLNPAMGLTKKFNAGITAYMGLNQGSRAPSAIELGCADPAMPCKLPNAMAGDPPLRQVVATTAEAGVRHNGILGWNLGVYRTDSRDDILFVADNAAGFGYFRNFGKTRRQGVEAGLIAELTDWTLGANYTLIDATYRSAELLNGSSNSSNVAAQNGQPGVMGEIAITAGSRMPLIPRQMLKLFAEARLTSTFAFSADVMLTEGSYARGNENNAHVPDGIYYLGSGHTSGYAVVNVGADWHPTTQITVFAQINNLLDREYNTAAQLGPAGLTATGAFQARPFPANANGDHPLIHSTFFAPGAPRTAWAGVRYRFGG